jgi:two-component system, NtrC family, sensor kinase
MLLVIALFNILLWVSLRDKAYLIYSAYVFSLLVNQACIDGNGLRYLFPNSPELASIALPFTWTLVHVFLFRFTRVFMDLKSVSPGLNNKVVWAEKICLIYAFVTIFVPYSVAIKPIAVAGLLMPLGFLGIGVHCLRKGYQPAKIYLLAFSALILGAVIFGLKTMSLLPANVFTNFSVLMGSALEVVLLSLALADRFRVIQEKEAASHAVLLETYRALDSELENREKLEFENSVLQNEILQASEQLIQADKLSTLGALAAGVAHDIANPTNLIVASVDRSRQSVAIVDDKLRGLLGEDSEEARAVYASFKKELAITESALEDVQLGATKITGINEAIRNQSRSDQQPESFLVKPLIDECATILVTQAHQCESYRYSCWP